MTGSIASPLSGRVALVTGASSGIGRTLAIGLAGAGARLVLAARRSDRLTEVVNSIEAEGGSAIATVMDVTDRATIEQSLDAAEAAYGTVDVLVNNAGVGEARPFLETDSESLDLTINTNFRGVWNVAQIGAARMVKASMPGSIVNVASVLGIGGKAKNSAYCASKGAVVQLTRAMAMGLSKNDIRVNAIAPGWFMTELNKDFLTSDAGQAYLNRTPARRAGRLEELVPPVVLLASHSASFINGIVMPIDGGHTATIV